MATRPGVSAIRSRRRRAAGSANASASCVTTSCGLRAGTLFPGFNRSPPASIAREEMIRLSRTFTAGLVGRKPVPTRVAPRIQERLHHAPARLDAVGALEQDRIADHAIVKERLVACARRGIEIVSITGGHS